jgi:hypothetical protein
LSGAAIASICGEALERPMRLALNAIDIGFVDDDWQLHDN